MRNGITAIVIVILVLGSLGLGYFAGSSNRQTVTTTSTVISSANKTSIATTFCTILGPTIGVVIRVIENQHEPTSPVVGASVSGEADGYCNNALQTQTLQPTTTNSSGWASLLDGGFGVYNLLISYDVGNPPLTDNYHLSITVEPTAVTYVVFNTTTGNVTTHINYLA